MTKTEAKAFIDSLIALRKSATDEQALSSLAVYPSWKEGVKYTINDRILYNEVLYKVLQAHTSQADYMRGNKVLHNGKIWVSIIDHNVWEPGACGWEEEGDAL